MCPSAQASPCRKFAGFRMRGKLFRAVMSLGRVWCPCLQLACAKEMECVESKLGYMVFVVWSLLFIYLLLLSFSTEFGCLNLFSFSSNAPVLFVASFSRVVSSHEHFVAISHGWVFLYFSQMDIDDSAWQMMLRHLCCRPCAGARRDVGNCRCGWHPKTVFVKIEVHFLLVFFDGPDVGPLSVLIVISVNSLHRARSRLPKCFLFFF